MAVQAPSAARTTPTPSGATPETATPKRASTAAASSCSARPPSRAPIDAAEQPPTTRSGKPRSSRRGTIIPRSASARNPQQGPVDRAQPQPDTGAQSAHNGATGEPRRSRQIGQGSAGRNEGSRSAAPAARLGIGGGVNRNGGFARRALVQSLTTAVYRVTEPRQVRLKLAED